MARKLYDPLIRAIANATNLDFYFVERQLTEMIKDLAPLVDTTELEKKIKMVDDNVNYLYEKLDSKKGLL